MGGLGGRGKGKRRRDRTLDSESVFDRKNGEFVRNKAHKLPPKPQLTQDEDNQHLPRKLRQIMKMMGKDPEEAAKAAKQSRAEAKSKNKYKHKDIERASKGKAASSLWFDADAGESPVAAGENGDEKPSTAEQLTSGEKVTKGGKATTAPASAPAPIIPVLRGEDVGREAPAALNKVQAQAKGRKKERLKRLQARKMDKALKQRLEAEMEEEEMHPKERRVDVVSFGEVAMQPPALTIKRKRGHESYQSTGGEQLEPLTKGQKLGALMARQMEAAQKVQAAPKVSSQEKLRLQIIEQYRRKRGRMPQPPLANKGANPSVIS
uniref:Uncharacterized protein n=1 Tax=Pyramimonas obovata TaxID=1411642 RepID=A0A7S0WUZ6_9CHLO|mmetsp:Transcript_4132/g.8474  ORF Transcript_4132/g.8474 Transcript_4132/m.8474 type:complete len:321 (+) Transcript_4132:247-1209(+)